MHLSDILALSLGFEGILTLKMYPDVDILWLDQGRRETGHPGDYPKRFVKTFARNRLRNYMKFLDNERNHQDDSEILMRISSGASNVGPRQDDPRDEKFATLIEQRAKEHANNSAVAIVGSYHAMDIDGSMRYLLEERGFICEVHLLEGYNSASSRVREIFRRGLV